MPSPARPRLHHIALTVTDLAASIDWYERIFGLTYRMEEPHPGGTGKLLADDEWQLVFVLHRHDANARETFAETQTGLDHIGMRVPSRADLEAWQAHLELLVAALQGIERCWPDDRVTALEARYAARLAARPRPAGRR